MMLAAPIHQVQRTHPALTVPNCGVKFRKPSPAISSNHGTTVHSMSAPDALTTVALSGGRSAAAQADSTTVPAAAIAVAATAHAQRSPASTGRGTPGLFRQSLERLYGNQGGSTSAGGARPARPLPPRFGSLSTPNQHHPSTLDAGEFDPLPLLEDDDDRGQDDGGIPDDEGPWHSGRDTARDRAGATNEREHPSSGRAPSTAAAVIEQPSPASTATDRRAHPRHQSGSTVSVAFVAGGDRPAIESSHVAPFSARLTGKLIDVSMSGLAFQLPEQIPTGTKVRLRIENRMLNRTVESTGIVVRCQVTEPRGWAVVCRLDKHLSFEQIHLIGRHLFAATIV